MARLYSDGAESGDTYRWTFISDPTDFVASTTLARSGNYSYRCNYTRYAYKTFTSSTEVYLRVAIYLTTAVIGANVVELRNSGTTVFGLRFLSTGLPGQIGVYVGGTQVATGNINCLLNEWHVYEIHFKDNSSGNIDVKFDGVQVITYAGNTTGGASSFDRFYLTSPVLGYYYFDDIAINDTSTANDNSWCGDGGYLAAVVPNGAGTYSDLTASAGSPYTCVDEIPPNTTDYIYGSIVDDKSSFTVSTLSSLPTGASIARVWVELYSEETAADGDNIATFLRSSTTNSTGSDQPLSTTYARYISDEYLVDPADSAAWTPTKVNALEIGAVVR